MSVSRRFEFSNSKHPKWESQIVPGSFLIASPALEATPFQRTVVFVLQHNQDGTFGAVVNRPADQAIAANWSRETGLEFERHNIVQGGPLGGPVLALHHEKPIAEVEISGGVCLSVDTQVFRKLFAQQESRYRIVLGIAGWEKNQLHQEINSGLWYHLVVDPMHVFDDHALMWENFLREYGRQTLGAIVDVRHFPNNPNMN